MKLIGAALPRTGTMSLFTALQQLGLRSYHMTEAVRNVMAGRGDLALWRQIVQLPPCSPERLALVRRLFAGYDACCDAPAAYLWRDLMVLYPDAPVLLTKRDPSRWRTSVRDTVWATERTRRSGPLGPTFDRIHDVMHRIPGLAGLIAAGRLLGDSQVVWSIALRQPRPPGQPGGSGSPADDAILDFDDEADAPEIERRFLAWIAEVEAEVPKERLIVLEKPYADAWQQICSALGRPIPDRPWPHVNDREDLKRAIGLMVMLFYVTPLVPLAGLGITLLALFSGAPLATVLGCALGSLLSLFALSALMRFTVNLVGARDKSQRPEAEAAAG